MKTVLSEILDAVTILGMTITPLARFQLKPTWLGEQWYFLARDWMRIR
jgi:hypothetical protein